jgi:hypothetical protein
MYAGTPYAHIMAPITTSPMSERTIGEIAGRAVTK